MSAPAVPFVHRRAGQLPGYGRRGDAAGFGDVLRRERQARRVSQSALAERAGFEHSYVSRLESGARTPTREAVLELSAALGLAAAPQDALLAAAGFLPRDPHYLLVGEPAVAELLTLLGDEAIDAAYRDGLREVVGLLVAQARLVKEGTA